MATYHKHVIAVSYGDQRKICRRPNVCAVIFSLRQANEACLQFPSPHILNPHRRKGVIGDAHIGVVSEKIKAVAGVCALIIDVRTGYVRFCLWSK